MEFLVKDQKSLSDQSTIKLFGALIVCSSYFLLIIINGHPTTIMSLLEEISGNSIGSISVDFPICCVHADLLPVAEVVLWDIFCEIHGEHQGIRSCLVRSKIRLSSFIGCTVVSGISWIWNWCWFRCWSWIRSITNLANTKIVWASMSDELDWIKLIEISLSSGTAVTSFIFLYLWLFWFFFLESSMEFKKSRVDNINWSWSRSWINVSWVGICGVCIVVRVVISMSWFIIVMTSIRSTAIVICMPLAVRDCAIEAVGKTLAQLLELILIGVLLMLFWFEIFTFVFLVSFDKSYSNNK